MDYTGFLLREEDVCFLEKLFSLTSQCLSQGISRPEVSKRLDRCNMNETFQIERCISLLAELSLSQYEKQKNCDCLVKPKSIVLVDEHSRCLECGKNLLE